MDEDGGKGHVGSGYVVKTGFWTSWTWWPIVLLFLFLVALPACSASKIEEGTYKEFLNDSCLPSDRGNVAFVHQYYMEVLRNTNTMNTTWLPLKRRDLGGWYWLSGEHQGAALSQSSTHGSDCAVLRAADKYLEDVDCNRKYQKYLCQKHEKPDCATHLNSSSCPHSNNGNSNFFVLNGMQYTIIMEEVNWYQARAGCYERGEELASLPKAHRQEIMETIRVLTKEYHDIWVGLRKKDYYIADRKTSVEKYYWDKSDMCPCKSHYNCVTIEETQENGFVWKPQNCSEIITYPVCEETPKLGRKAAMGTYDQCFGTSCFQRDIGNAPFTHHYFVEILERIKRRTVGATWLPIKRRDFGGWHWLSGEKQGTTLSPSYTMYTYGEDCGVLRAADMHFDGVVCTKKYQKYLCQKPGFSKCPPEAHNCFVLGGMRYTIVMERSDWYKARARCYERGEQLASLPGTYKRQIMKTIHALTETYHDIWVGLRKKDYYIDKRSTSVETFYWDKAGPCPCKSKFDCVTVEGTRDKGFFWKPRNCSHSMTYLVCKETRARSETTTKRGRVVPGQGKAPDEIQTQKHAAQTVVPQLHTPRKIQSGPGNIFKNNYSDLHATIWPFGSSVITFETKPITGTEIAPSLPLPGIVVIVIFVAVLIILIFPAVKRFRRKR